MNGKYLSNIINAPEGQYLCVCCKAGLTHTNKTGYVPRYSNLVCYNPKVRSKILSPGLVKKHLLVTYNSVDWNEFFVHNPQRPKFKMTKVSLFYHDMRHLLKNNNVHIMVNELRSPIPQVEKNRKQYTVCAVKRDDCTRIL